MTYEEEIEEPKPRKPSIQRLTSKANSRRAELLERTINFLSYKGSPKVFAIKTSFLKEDDLEYLLSVAKAWKKNGPACWWKIFNESKPK